MDFADLLFESLKSSAERLLDLSSEESKLPAMRIQAGTGTGGASVIMVQIIDPATEEIPRANQKLAYCFGCISSEPRDWNYEEIVNVLI